MAGPGLIVGSVLVVLHGFWLSARLTNQQVDQLAFWLPRWCFLGRTLAHGHLPGWLPNQFAGVPFLSDPQSGWLYLPAMLLFSVTSCGRALGLFVTLQPILAGLGLYWFFRNEQAGRIAATVAGLTLALSMAGSTIALSVPFSGTLAWTALALAGAAGYLHAGTPVRRLGWFAVAELCLVQVAAAHLTDGLLIAGVVLGLYVLARSVALVRTGERSPGPMALAAIGLFGAFPVLAAGVLIPRLAFLPRTSIGRGYLALGRLANVLSGTHAPPPLASHAIGPWWGTAFARGPGAYAGAIAVLLVPLGFFSRRWRLPATAFTLAGLLGWVLNLDGLVASAGVRSFVLRSSLGELWLRDPHRFRYLLPIAVATLAGYGVQGWLDLPSRPTLARTAKRALWWVPSLVVLVVAPLIAGSKPGSYLPLLLGAVVAAPLLLTAASGRGWARAALPVVTAAELVIVALVTQPGVARPTPQLASGVDRGLGHAFPVLHAPTIRPAAYLAPGPIAATIRANAPLSRYLTFDPATSANPANPRGFLSYQQPPDWPADENGRSVLFGLNEVQGYSPVQLFPYWSLVRRVDRRAPIFYNAAHLQRLDPAVLELFGVGWIIEPTGLRPRPDGDRVATEGRYSLYRLSSPTPRASLVFRWRRVPPATGLDAVLSHGFDARREAIVAPAHQATPPVPPAATPKHARASATYQQLSPDHVRVRVSVSAAALLVVRNAYDRNWSATVDGAPAPVFVADYLMQGVPVPSGTHVVELRYRDRPAEVGLVTSAAAWLILIVLILVMTKAGRSSQRRKRDPAAHSGPPL